MIKLIASDLDGTLLKNGAQELPPDIFPIIRELRQKGIRFVAASGRQYYNLRLLFKPVRDEIFYIAENGSLCICNDQPRTWNPYISRSQRTRRLPLSSVLRISLLYRFERPGIHPSYPERSAQRLTSRRPSRKYYGSISESCCL